jgi:predicted metalloprotease with PDZ domain
MLHLGFPDLAARHKWMQEGLSTYLEPVVRAHAGVVAPAEVWQNWVERMPHGLPGPGDAGLDHTPTWGRTYWGGAIFWLLVDIEVRRRTDGRCSIRTILLALLDAGGDHRVTWPIERVLEASDAAVGVPVFTELYRQHARASTDVELDTLWTELGIVVNGDSVTYDDSAPLASVRAAILDPGWH